MGVFRGLGRWANVGLGLVVLAPALALLPAAALDRGPAGGGRAAVFPVALAVLDPFVRDCVRNSAAVAGVVAVASGVVGIALAGAVARRRFWGRLPLAALALGTVAVPPMVGAFGLRMLLGTRLGAGLAGVSEDWGGWLCWVWVGVAAGAPLVALVTASALARVEPSWEDAARLAGAGRGRAWRQLIWPVVRPDAMRGVAAVFALTLLEPGAPLVLGLRRTLAFQVVEATRAAEPFPRAAVLTLAGVGLVLIGRVLARWWGGTRVALAPRTATVPLRPESWPRAARNVAILTVWAALAWLPALAVVSAGMAPGSTPYGIRDPETQALVLRSLALGFAVVVLDLALAARPRRHAPAGAALAQAFPPLAIGVGALALPWLLQLAAESIHGTSGTAGPLARGIRGLAAVLDPYRTPGVLLAIALAAVRQPVLAHAVEASRRGVRRVLIDAAAHFGVSPRAARRRASRSLLAAAPGAFALTLVLTATNLAPALVLAPTAAGRPAAPVILDLADAPGDGLRHAAGLASWMLFVNALAIGLAARGGIEPIADAARGGV